MFTVHHFFFSRKVKFIISDVVQIEAKKSGFV